MTVGITVGLSVGVTCGVTAGMDESGTVAATLATLSLSPQVETTTTPWAATLTWHTLGTGGNSGDIDFRFDQGSAGVEVRDGHAHTGAAWVAAPGTIGIRARSDLGDPLTVGTIEAAINASSSLAQVTTADPAPTKEIDYGLMDTTNCSGTFSGGL